MSALPITRVVVMEDRAQVERSGRIAMAEGLQTALWQLGGLQEVLGDGALLHAANFSVGVHLFLRAARDLATWFAGRAEFDAFILEEHHAAKRDAPSGTASVLRAAVREADPAREVPVTSVRAGSIPGTHVLTYDGPCETVSLSHVARSRQGFAAGALAAAEWLPGRPGVHRFESMLFGGSG